MVPKIIITPDPDEGIVADSPETRGPSFRSLNSSSGSSSRSSSRHSSLSAIEPTISVRSQVQPYPMWTFCPKCSEHVKTQTTLRPNKLSRGLCLVSILLGCCFGCCLIPLSIPRLNNVEHRCPRCRHRMVTFRPRPLK